jgi:hypothetical protein
MDLWRPLHVAAPLLVVQSGLELVVLVPVRVVNDDPRLHVVFNELVSDRLRDRHREMFPVAESSRKRVALQVPREDTSARDIFIVDLTIVLVASANRDPDNGDWSVTDVGDCQLDSMMESELLEENADSSLLLLELTEPQESCQARPIRAEKEGDDVKSGQSDDLSSEMAALGGPLGIADYTVPGTTDTFTAPNGLELSCPAEAGNAPLLYARPAGDSSLTESATRRVSFSELLGGLTSDGAYGDALTTKEVPSSYRGESVKS